MSNMLEKSIVDAKSLREAATKNAENKLLEKYANQIKEAVNSLLDKDPIEDETEEGLPPDAILPGMENDMGGQMGGQPNQDLSMAPKISLGAADGEKLCSCPDEDEEIEIDFSDLEKEMTKEKEPDYDEQDLLNREDIMGEDSIEMGMGGLEDDKEKKIGPDPDSWAVGQPKEFDPKDLEGLDFEDLELDDEEIDLKEEDISQILEDLKVDLAPTSDGWIGSTEAQKKEETDFTLAKAEDDETKEEETEEKKKKLEDVGHELNEQKEKILKLEDKEKQLQEKVNKLEKEKEALKSVLSEAKQKIKDINLTNAKLLYMNKTVTDGSLNERQKTRLIESLSKSSTIEEAKTIYESLKLMDSSNSKEKKVSKSLQEVISAKPSSLIIAKRDTNKDVTDLVKDRMKVLAGIKGK